jgi:DNA polymerase V
MMLIDAGSCGSSEPFALRVIGDDMSPEFEDGHIVIIDPGGQVRTGCFVVAKVEDDVILRQLIIEGGSYQLKSLKVGIADIVLSRGLENLVGVVSQRAGKRRKQHKRYD